MTKIVFDTVYNSDACEISVPPLKRFFHVKKNNFSMNECKLDEIQPICLYYLPCCKLLASKKNNAIEAFCFVLMKTS